MASSSGFFGAGFAQGLGGALANLPQILQQRDLRLAREETVKLQQQQLKLKQKMLENQVNQLAAQPEILKNFGQWIAGQGQGQGQPAAAPQAGGLQQLMTSGDPAPAASAVPAPAAPPLPVPSTGGGVEPGGNLPITSDGGGTLPEVRTMEPSLRMNKDGTLQAVMSGKVLPYHFEYKTVDLGNGNYQNIEIATNPLTGQERKRAVGVPVPPQTIENAAQMVEGFGVTRGTDIFKKLTQQMSFAMSLPEAERGAAMMKVQEVAKAAAQNLGAPAGGADLSNVAELGRQEKAKDIESESAAKAKGSVASQRKMVTGVLDKMKTALDGIQLPTDGPGRLSESPRLLGESLSQSNPSIVEFETLKAGFLATVARAVGERGVLTDTDAARAAALFPNVKPGKGYLPDTKTIADKKMKDLYDLIGEFSQRDPGFGKEVGQTSKAQNTSGPELSFDNVGMQSAFEKIKKKFPKMSGQEMADYYLSHGGSAQ